MKSVEIQRSIIAGILNDENCLFDALQLTEDDFTTKAFKDIFTTAKKLVEKEEEVNIMTVYTELNGQIPMSELAEISNGLFLKETFETQVKDLKDITLKRKLKNVLNQAQQDEESKGIELVDRVEQKLHELRDDGITGDFYSTQDITMDVFKHLEDVHAGKIDRGLSTGYSAIDRAVGGLRKGEYILLGARPSMGKTALGLNIATNVAKKGKSVAIFSYEMTKEMLVQRMISSEGHVDLYNKDKMDWERAIGGAGQVSNLDLAINDDPRITVPEMLGMLRKIKRRKGLDLVVVDYLQKIPAHTNKDARKQLEDVSSSLKNMAKLLNVPVLVISSLSRGSEQRQDKVPMMSDLRDSGAIEFDADVIMFLHRPSYYEREEYNPDAQELAEIHIAKNRNGGLGIVQLWWRASWTKFFPIDHTRE